MGRHERYRVVYMRPKDCTEYLRPLQDSRYGPLRLRTLPRHHSKMLEMEKALCTSTREGSRQIYYEMIRINGVCLKPCPAQHVLYLRFD